MDEVSKIWPQWKIEEFIGKGAYGKVYKVCREEQGHVSYAAVKIIEIPQDESEIKELLYAGMDQVSIHAFFQDMIRGLDNEIRVMESLKTAENIVSIENYYFEEHKDEIGWTIYIQMELLESLPHYIERIGKSSSSLSAEEIAKLGINICSALECCEQEKIIHRDIKPDNIFRNKYGTYKLGDFGVARQMEKTKGTMSQKGTSMYMAPEVYLGEGYGHTVDIYSLGITLYKLLNAGRFPFYPTDRMIKPGDSDMAMARRMRGDKMPVPCNADEILAGIVLRACEFRPEDRYQSASAMKQKLETWLYEERSGKPHGNEFKRSSAQTKCNKTEAADAEEETSQMNQEEQNERTWRAFSTETRDKKEGNAKEKKKDEDSHRREEWKCLYYYIQNYVSTNGLNYRDTSLSELAKVLKKKGWQQEKNVSGSKLICSYNIDADIRCFVEIEDCVQGRRIRLSNDCVNENRFLNQTQRNKILEVWKSVNLGGMIGVDSLITPEMSRWFHGHCKEVWVDVSRQRSFIEWDNWKVRKLVLDNGNLEYEIMEQNRKNCISLIIESGKVKEVKCFFDKLEQKVEKRPTEQTTFHWEDEHQSRNDEFAKSMESTKRRKKVKKKGLLIGIIGIFVLVVIIVVATNVSSSQSRTLGSETAIVSDENIPTIPEDEITAQWEALYQTVETDIVEGAINYREDSIETIAVFLQERGWKFTSDYDQEYSSELPDLSSIADEETRLYCRYENGEEKYEMTLSDMDFMKFLHFDRFNVEDMAKFIEVYKEIDLESVGNVLASSTISEEMCNKIQQDGVLTNTGEDSKVYEVHWGEWGCCVQLFDGLRGVYTIENENSASYIRFLTDGNGNITEINDRYVKE